MSKPTLAQVMYLRNARAVTDAASGPYGPCGRFYIDGPGRRRTGEACQNAGWIAANGWPVRVLTPAGRAALEAAEKESEAHND